MLIVGLLKIILLQLFDEDGYFRSSAACQGDATTEPGDTAGSDGRQAQSALCDGDNRFRSAAGRVTREWTVRTA